MKDYHIYIFYSQEDQGYIADIPDLKHYSAYGQNAQEALSEVLKAKEAWIETAKGKTIPKPKYKPIIYQIA